MPRSLKILSGVAALLAIVVVAALLLVRANVSKPMLESAASEALGMDVRVGGGLATGIFPTLHVIMEDVGIRNLGMDVATSRQARVWIDFLPLLRKQVRIGKIALSDTRISIERNRDGKFNFEKPQAAAVTLPALDLASISVSDGTLYYANQQSGEKFELRHCSLAVHRLRLLRGKKPDFMKHLSLSADLACGEFQDNDLTASDLKFSVDGKDGVFHFKPVTVHLFGAQGSGTVEADYSKAVPHYHVRYSLPQFPIEEFLKTRSPRRIASGPMEFEANLTMQGKTVHEMRQTMAGRISLRGKGLTLEGVDIDREFSEYAASQKFSLVDTGAFFFAGPLGLVVTKGYDYAVILRGSGGSSEIHELVSDWSVESGVAHAQDVAFATRKNRMALQGGLDFVNHRFVDVTTALIDAKGCAMVTQEIHGTFLKPVTEPPSILRSLAGPAFRLLKKARDFFPGGDCKVFYAGSVAPPR